VPFVIERKLALSSSDAWNAWTRRDWVRHVGAGFGGAALASLLANDLTANDHADKKAQPETTYDLEPKAPHFSPRARSVIQLMMPGGPSHVDMLDPKPALERYHGKRFPGVIDAMNADKAGAVMQSPFRFARSGKSGIEVSDLLPNLARVVDKLTVVRSMYTEHINHEPAVWMMNTGRTIPGRPSAGSWVVYGLGTENQDLPAYVALEDPKGELDGIRNWSAGWLPPVYQGTPFRAVGSPVLNLKPSRSLTADVQSRRQAYLSALAEDHRRAHPGESELAARIASYELAARMQISASDALDVNAESAATREAYGMNDEVTASYARRCLMARRLVERGVRFVQVFMDFVWDQHTNLETGLRENCARTDRPIAALIADLDRLGLLNQTLVMWGGEFGRLPVSEAGNGRDHNPRGFTCWLAGGGVKAGHIHGATDELGYEAVTDRVGVPDLHATMLHLLGLDFKRLTYPVHGLEESLISTIYKPRVVKEIIA
jgi:hypothetical protein